MPDLRQFRLPDVGEGLTEADILTWSVAPGDRVVVNQVLVEVETAKAAVELPSPFAGIVVALHAEPGETVEVGRAIITIDIAPLAPVDTAPAGADPTSAQSTDRPATVGPAASGPASVRPFAGGPASSGLAAVGPAAGGSAATGPAAGGSAASGAAAAVEAPREAVLVGYGPRSGPARRRVRRTPAASELTPNAQAAFAVDPGPLPLPPAEPPHDAAVLTFAPGSRPVPPASPTGPRSTNGSHRALAKPPVRMLAKSLGVDLDGLDPTGPNGSVSRDDVERAAAGADERAKDAVGVHGAAPARVASADRSAREERIPIKGVRKHTAAAMVASAFTAPHVTLFVAADVTAMMDLRQRLATRREFAGVKLSPLALVARAAIWAIARTPIVNSSWDEAAGEIVVKHYVNLGIAAATGRGLVVPNITDADGLSLRELAQALGDLAETARAGRTTPGAMAGGTFTITNVGVFGVDAGTPILNPGEAAILAFGTVRRAPWVVRGGDDEAIEARWVTQLALSVDHRVVDGAQASTFLADVAAVLTDPGLALT